MKATEAKVKKAKKVGQKKTVKPDAEPAVAEVQETAPQPRSLEVFKNSLEKERELQNLRKKETEELAKAVKLIAFDPNPESRAGFCKKLWDYFASDTRGDVYLNLFFLLF